MTNSQTESEIIEFFKNKCPQAIGDDAFVFPYSRDQSYVITKDLLVEDIHFRTHYSCWDDIGHKAVHANVSDIAAMGATPLYLLLGLAIPKSLQSNSINQLINSIHKACKDLNIQVTGGDTVRSADNNITISITVIGSAPSSNIKYRSNASPGDVICLLGEAGEAHIGLTALEESTHDNDQYQYFKQKLLRPTSLVNEGKWLAQHHCVKSMMDVSDGIIVDMKKLCSASSVGARININALPCSNALQQACHSMNLDSVSVQLTGGEDYSLLFTVRHDHYHDLAKKFHQHFKYHINNIGEITADNSLSIYNNNVYIVEDSLLIRPFSHF